jgi:hypothetical protein
VSRKTRWIKEEHHELGKDTGWLLGFSLIWASFSHAFSEISRHFAEIVGGSKSA